MPNYNKVFFIGHVTRDPEVKYIASGTAVCEVGLAVNEKYKDKETTLFIDVVFWGKRAETAGQYIRKGAPLFVEGKLKQDSWEKDGQKHTKFRVNCDNFQLLGGKKQSTPSEREPAQKYYDPPSQDNTPQGVEYEPPSQDSDVPF